MVICTSFTCHVCIHVTCVYSCMSPYVYVYTYICVFIHIYISIYIYTNHMCIHTKDLTHISRRAYIYNHICIHTKDVQMGEHLRMLSNSAGNTVSITGTAQVLMYIYICTSRYIYGYEYICMYTCGCFQTQQATLYQSPALPRY